MQRLSHGVVFLLWCACEVRDDRYPVLEESSLPAQSVDAALNKDADAGLTVEQELWLLDFGLRTQLAQAAQSVCAACAGKLGYGSLRGCLLEHGGDAPPEQSDLRLCHVRAYALEPQSSKEHLRCWQDVEGDYAQCIGLNFDCSSARLDRCQRSYENAAAACPEPASIVHRALQACF